MAAFLHPDPYLKTIVPPFWVYEEPLLRLVPTLSVFVIYSFTSPRGDHRLVACAVRYFSQVLWGNRKDHTLKSPQPSASSIQWLCLFTSHACCKCRLQCNTFWSPLPVFLSVSSHPWHIPQLNSPASYTLPNQPTPCCLGHRQRSSFQYTPLSQHL